MRRKKKSNLDDIIKSVSDAFPAAAIHILLQQSYVVCISYIQTKSKNYLILIFIIIRTATPQFPALQRRRFTFLHFCAYKLPLHFLLLFKPPPLGFLRRTPPYTVAGNCIAAAERRRKGKKTMG